MLFFSRIKFKALVSKGLISVVPVGYQEVHWVTTISDEGKSCEETLLADENLVVLSPWPCNWYKLSFVLLICLLPGYCWNLFLNCMKVEITDQSIDRSRGNGDTRRIPNIALPSLTPKLFIHISTLLSWLRAVKIISACSWRKITREHTSSDRFCVERLF